MKRYLHLVVVSLSGCSALRPAAPIVVNRFHLEKYAEPLGDNPIQVSVTSADADSDSGGGVAITALSDRAQAAMVEQNKGKPPIKLAGKSKAAGSIDLRNGITRRLVVTVRPTGFLPSGDRIEAIRLQMWINDGENSRWKIVSWTQASDTRNTIEVGKLTGVSETKVNASTGLNLGGILPGLTVGAERSRSDTAELTVKDQDRLLAGVEQDGHAWLLARGGEQNDLSQNFSMDVVAITPAIETTGYDVVSASDLYTSPDEGLSQPQKGSDVQLHKMTVYSPVAGQLEPICGKVHLDYRLRHIDPGKGNATLPESDDDVEFLTKASDAGFLFAPPPFNPTYGIQAGERDLHYMIGKKPDRLTFASLDEATDFLNWLRVAKITQGRLDHAQIGYYLGQRWHPLAPADITSLLVLPSDGEVMAEVAAKVAKGCPAPASPPTL